MVAERNMTYLALRNEPRKLFAPSVCRPLQWENRPPGTDAAPGRAHCPRAARQRGTASLEAIIIITFFTLVWTGVDFMHEVANVSLTTKAHARFCAFAATTNSCEEMPPSCQGEAQGGPQSEAEAESAKVLDETADKAEDSKYTEAPLNEMKESFEFGLFQRIEASMPASVDTPQMLGGQTTDLSQSFSLPCNPKPATFGEKVKEMFDEIFDGVIDDILSF